MSIISTARPAQSGSCRSAVPRRAGRSASALRSSSRSHDPVGCPGTRSPGPVTAEHQIVDQRGISCATSQPAGERPRTLKLRFTAACGSPAFDPRCGARPAPSCRRSYLVENRHDLGAKIARPALEHGSCRAHDMSRLTRLLGSYRRRRDVRGDLPGASRGLLHVSRDLVHGQALLIRCFADADDDLAHVVNGLENVLDSRNRILKRERGELHPT